jgi:hypothetical protein
VTDFLAQIVTWINVPINAAGKFLFSSIGVMPGWLSNTIISAFTGVFLLLIFKYTSNQSAIGKVRDGIKANILALKLFKDSISVTLRTQGHLFKGAFLLLFHAIRPMLVMILPVSLLLGQLGLWYQSKPLSPGQEALVTIKFNDSAGSSWENVSIETTTAIDLTSDPVRIFSSKEVNWKIKGRENGYHRLVFQMNGQKFEKELAVGEGFMRVSIERPAWSWTEILLHPLEEPFKPDSIVKSINIDYPERYMLVLGIPWWLLYFFIASMVFALIFKPLIKVRI